MDSEQRFLLAFDAGGTTIRAIIYKENGDELARAFRTTSEIRSEQGAVEHDPEELFQALLAAGREALSKAAIPPEKIAGAGITVQRATFCLWDKKSGKPQCNFISWSDVRAGDKAFKMNRSCIWSGMKIAAAVGGFITRSPMLTATGMLSFVTDHVLVRLCWLFEQRPELRQAAKRGDLLFGTIETWFLYRLTGNRVHATDTSNAAATSLYNPFEMKWNAIFCKLFSIPMRMLPEVKNSADQFGLTDPSCFGASIPITALIGDQMAALFGHGCFTPGDVKISQGSGSFVDINVGRQGKVSRRGLFPLIAWTLRGKPVYMLEGSVATAGRLIDWLGNGIGLSDTPAVLNDYASQCDDTEGVIFVPTAAGIRFPYFNPKARGTIFGLSLSTHRRHVARAVLEGIAHRVVDILEGIEKDTGMSIRRIKVDGGVSRSNVLLQAIADLSGHEVERPDETDMTARGTAALAGLGAGVWKSEEELGSMRMSYDHFHPHFDHNQRREKRRRWNEALKTLVKLYH
ncbi:glycerol kinase 5 [Sediminispirochaeta bajacaliforniensis]|uniref:glycerol kinase 5 n=1 Tax=Sediminispirochaeta bajacaliforniensis TaxID=148 RepID=UPI00036D0D06|nr:FGGY family carbohydrate kinase [Sediminispirochaeta bajacaliforniensis]